MKRPLWIVCILLSCGVSFQPAFQESPSGQAFVYGRFLGDVGGYGMGIVLTEDSGDEVLLGIGSKTASDLFAVQLKPGRYRITHFLFSSDGERRSIGLASSIVPGAFFLTPFEVRPGRAVYLGNFRSGARVLPSHESVIITEVYLSSIKYEFEEDTKEFLLM